MSANIVAIRWGKIKSLRGADLRGADLWGAALRGADLSGANLRGADLRGADLWGAALRGADLSGAILWGADLRGANLWDADLRDAGLRHAVLWGADLRGADLRGANLWGANLWGANPRNVHVNWASHDLLSYILQCAAGPSVERRMIAGLILVSRDWCLKEFLAIDHPERTWALRELARWETERSPMPSPLKKAAEEAEKETT